MSDYLTLVSKSGQVNTPPGSYKTVKEWIGASFMSSNSKVLEVGCSTGFISIELARYVGATCIGLDLHEASIEAAKNNADPYVKRLVSFVQGDAGALQFPDHSFSHTVISGHLPFVPSGVRKAHVAEAVRVTKPWGYILTALYFYKKTPPPPARLVKKFNDIVGTQLKPSNDYKYWASLFDGQPLTLEHESLNEVVLADSERLAIYLRQLTPESRTKWKTRLELFNANGEYISYFVRVYRRIPTQTKVMIQIPRGGIYKTSQTLKRSF